MHNCISSCIDVGASLNKRISSHNIMLVAVSYRERGSSSLSKEQKVSSVRMSNASAINSFVHSVHSFNH